MELPWKLSPPAEQISLLTRESTDKMFAGRIILGGVLYTVPVNIKDSSNIKLFYFNWKRSHSNHHGCEPTFHPAAHGLYMTAELYQSRQLRCFTFLLHFLKGPVWKSHVIQAKYPKESDQKVQRERYCGIFICAGASVDTWT